MRDRLCDLQEVTHYCSETEGNNSNVDESELEHHELVFEGETTMEDVFNEAQSMAKEIVLLKIDVKRLGKQNTRFLTSVRRISSIKRDSNAIGRSIKARGEGIYAQLQKMAAQKKELEDKHGEHAAIVRMVHGQYVSLTSSFHEAMSGYNEAEMAQKENCKTRIQRQAEIMGKEVTRDQIEEMIETGKWNVFSENLLTDGKTARSALNEIENRHKELMELEGRIRDVHDLFFQMALLVEEQGCKLNNIEANVCATKDYLGKATAQIKQAVIYKKKNPCKQLFCCCFPCCK